MTARVFLKSLNRQHRNFFTGEFTDDHTISETQLKEFERLVRTEGIKEGFKAATTQHLQNNVCENETFTSLERTYKTVEEYLKTIK